MNSSPDARKSLQKAKTSQEESLRLRAASAARRGPPPATLLWALTATAGTLTPTVREYGATLQTLPRGGRSVMSQLATKVIFGWPNNQSSSDSK